MSRILSLFTLLLMYGVMAVAQTRTVTGKVIDEKGAPIPFASILIEGTSKGTSTNEQGSFSVEAQQGAVLVISAAGMESERITVKAANTYSVSLKKSGTLDEVVVTALGIRRKPKELGYSASTIKSEQITAANNPNLASALTGKVSGLMITNVNSSVQGNTRVVLRGNRSITGNNQALIVVDGVPVPNSTLDYLNPNDIESVTTLKGGQAATLYGSDGVNGAIVINTKKGRSGRNVVTLTSSANLEQVSFMPEFQNEFGNGSGYAYTPEQNFRSFENQSYGARYDGSRRPLGRVTEDNDTLMVPYTARPNEKRKIWDLGNVVQNDISVSGGDEKSSFYMSFQDALISGVTPGDNRRRDAFRFNGSRTVGKLKAGFQATYAQDRFDRTNADFYSAVLNAAAHVPLTELRDWQTNKFANPNGYYNDYVNNPWFNLDNQRWRGNTKSFNGSFDLQYSPVSWFGATYRLGLTNTNLEEKITTGQFLYSNWAKNDAYVPKPWSNDYDGIDRAGADILGGVRDRINSANRVNSDLLVTFKKDFENITTSLILGNNIQQRTTNYLNVQSGSIVIPELYNISNRTGELVGDQTYTMQRKYGFYGDLTVGLNDYLFLHTAARRDGTSLFFKEGADKSSYQYWYYGADLSFVVTDAIPSLKTGILDYLKVRAGYNKNANDNIGTYSLDLVYNLGAGFPYGSLPGTTVDNTFPSASLKPEFVKSFEGGFELQLLKNRIGLDFTYYYQVSDGQIIDVDMSAGTGYRRARLNAGRMDNKGFEAELKVQAVKTKNVSWDVNINYSYNDNVVKELYGNMSALSLGTSYTESGVVTANTYAEKGNSYPYLKVTAFKRDSLGRIVVNATTGYPVRSTEMMSIGRTIPKHNLGITSRVTYKNFALSATAEYRGGHYVFHGLGSTMTFTGVAAVTTKYGRENFVVPNSSYDDGTGKFVPNTSIAVADGHWAFWDSHFKYAGENFVTKGDFWKLREVNLTYSLPAAIVNKVRYLKSASFSLIGRNLLTLLPKDNVYTDPEFASTTGNGVGINNTLNTPPVRSYGATLALTF
ncbi:SusC/RagA family TonB-linked outer membrane protein [Paraflavitalea sp. CAU 1676]|uniref:SusC/RagA family TonB-linked outer membrane protein n=1 Tax=Paraflavitalea sp. CAU 1676 TaxID=3032598 RepID=UPI0023DCB209|nr:SusC/RagA family TonB-linked outer membrane protein [Paraflavitalea sp. CAU 1676]MDF2188119.1 SusC/RagA family TonB-linked outer membrane protein [Paraflavitalea sp. CAU 1676]